MIWMKRLLNLAGLVALVSVPAQFFLEGPLGVSLALLVVLVLTVLWYLVAAPLGVRLSGAMPLSSYIQDPDFLAMASEEATRLGFTCPPSLYYVESVEANAYALGRPGSGAVIFTTRLLEHLSGPQWMAILGHEYGHIKRYDTLFVILNIVASFVLRLAAWAGTVAAFILGLAFEVTMAWAGTSRPGQAAGRTARNGVGLVQWFGRISIRLNQLLMVMVSREAELCADAAGARTVAAMTGGDLTDGARHMAEAIDHLDRLNQVDLCGVSWVSRLYSSHPATHARLRALRRLAEGV